MGTYSAIPIYANELLKRSFKSFSILSATALKTPPPDNYSPPCTQNYSIKKILIQSVNMAHICENDMIQIKDMFQIVATWLLFSTEE